MESLILSELVIEKEAGNFDAFLQSGSPAAQHRSPVFEFRRKNGSTVLLECQSTDTRRFGGRPARLFLLRDVTLEQKAEEQVLEAAQQARRRLARDLHDGLGQHITGLHLKLNALKQSLNKDTPVPDSIDREFEGIDSAMNGIRQTSRRTVRGLEWLIEGGDNLVEALDLTVTESADRLGIEIAAELEPLIEITSRDKILNLCLLMEEAFNNAVRHGNASRIQVTLSRQETSAKLEISDNGSGRIKQINPDSGMGIRTMTYRANILGGKAEFVPASGSATGINVVVKFAADLPDKA